MTFSDQLSTIFQDCANSIRAVNGLTTTYTPDQFADAISTNVVGIQPIEYLQNPTGSTLYINTNYVANISSEFEVEFKANETRTSEGVIMGRRSSSEGVGNDFSIWSRKANTGIAFHTGYGRYKNSGYILTSMVVSADWVSCDILSSGIWVNGVSAYAPLTGNAYTVAIPVTLFAINGNATGRTSILYPFEGSIRKFIVKENGVKVRDMIPVRVGTTGFMYDKANNKLYGAQSTGDFVCGPDLT